MKNPIKIVWITIGFLCLGLGTVGIVKPGEEQLYE